ncbi:MAG: LuxR C-terminal-related transcriptional regulator [Halioglobus sp.]
METNGACSILSGMTKVLLVEDNQPTLERLAGVIQQTDGLELLGAAATFAQAQALLEQEIPEVLLTDLGLPDGSGIDLIRQVRGYPEPIEAMVISVFGDERNVINALEAGAAGYILKDDSMENIGNAVLQLMAGGSPISPSIARHLLRRFQPSEQGAETNPVAAEEETTHPPSPLSARETDVLTAVAKGFTYNEIAKMLNISFHTVSSHIKHIYRKLEVSSRSEAVFEALNLRYIDLD